jgi:hypothetical protein
MPCRKKTKIRPNYSFVTVGYEPKEASWRKIHSGAARSHAAYWGGSAKQQRDNNARIITADTDMDSTSHLYSSPSLEYIDDLAIQYQGSPTNFNPLCYNQYDDLQHLLTVPSEIQATGFPSTAGLATLTFCGEDFVRNFFTTDHEDYSIMFGGCVLISYAHSMALTGQGSKTILLHLKGQVIRRISARIKSSNGLLSPWCLTAILALAAPIVCLVSQDMPKNLTVWEYIIASVKDDFICGCPESAEKAQSAAEERVIHRHAIHKLLLKSLSSFQDTDSFAFLNYVSNSVDVYVSSNLLRMLIIV